MKNGAHLLIFSMVLVVATSLVACTTSPSTYYPMPTSESTTSDGFSFSVTVSNTHLKLGESTVITNDLQNISNDHLPQAAIMDGLDSILVTDEAGKWLGASARCVMVLP